MSTIEDSIYDRVSRMTGVPRADVKRVAHALSYSGTGLSVGPFVPSKSYPYLSISKHFDIDYVDVLLYADRIGKGGDFILSVGRDMNDAISVARDHFLYVKESGDMSS